MLALGGARVKFEANWEREGAAPAPLTPYTETRVKQELVASPEISQPPEGLPAQKPGQTVKREGSDTESDSGNDSDSIASSEYSGEFLTEAAPASEEERSRPCTVLIETDPIVELMCTLLLKKNSFPCDACGAQFKRQRPFIKHLKKCSKMKKEDRVKKKQGKIVCVICNLQYTRKEDFDRHFRYCVYRMKQRSDDKLYICDYCCKRYTRRYSFMLHIRKCSRDGSQLEVKKVPKVRYTCESCPKQFATKALMRVHIRVHHTGEKPYQCLLCEKRFNQCGDFKRHQLTHQSHAENKFLTCDHCGRQFAYKTDMVQHMVVHTKLKKCSCTTCGKKFSSKKHMSRHMLTHFPETAKKNYPCDVCGKNFLERSNLLVHMRVHTGEKPYSCSFCSTRFSYLTSLVRHESIHMHERGPFPCCVCKKLFNSKKRLTNHVRFHIWMPNCKVEKRSVERFDCSVRLARLSPR